ncbi:ferritin [Candidatus Latescibacterota bacterium]
MLKKKMERELNAQVNAELYSAYLYLSMESYFQSQNLRGFANWIRVQAQEEVSHAMKIYDYIIERGGRVTLTAIEGPKGEWKSPLEALTDTLAHEQKVTGLINGLVDLAIAEKDHATGSFLKWFVDEQVEEEANADGLVEQLKLVGKAPGGLFMVDQELGKRSFAAPE